MNEEARRRRTGGARYPASRTSPWFFWVLAGATAVIILAGVFQFAPLAKLVHWLAVVL